MSIDFCEAGALMLLVVMAMTAGLALFWKEAGEMYFDTDKKRIFRKR